MQVDEKTQAPESKVAEDAYPPHYSTYQRPGQRYSARAVDEHELYKEKGIRLAQGSELLLKHTDGQALSKEEVDALYSDHEEHTKQLFKNLQRLQSQRQKALKKAQQRTPPSSKTRRSTRVRVKTSSRRGKTPKSSFSGQLPRTPKSATIDNDAKTIRFRDATSSGNPRNQPAQPSQGPAPTGAHRGAAQLDEESKSSEAGFAAKRRNVAPLQPTHVNATKGTPRSTEFTHGAQYTRHAHMAHNQQMSTDPHPNPMYAKMTPHAQQQAPSNNGRPMSAGNAPTAHQARAERQSFDEEDSSSGGGMFPPDPDPDSTKTRIPPNRARGKSSSRTSSRQSAANASRHTASRIRDKKKSGRPKKPKPPPEPARVSATATDNASKKDIPPVKPKVAQPSKLEMKEIAAILRTVQGSISELSSKMGECTEAIRSLSKDQRKAQQKGASADLQTGEIIQESINVLSRNVHECSKAVHNLADNVVVTKLASPPQGGGSQRPLQLHAPPQDTEFLMKKLSSMQNDIRDGMRAMQQQLTERIDSTFADWLVEGTAKLEETGRSPESKDRVSSVELLRRQTAQARSEPKKAL